MWMKDKIEVNEKKKLTEQSGEEMNRKKYISQEEYR